MISFKKIYICLVIFTCVSVTIFASQEIHNNLVKKVGEELLEQEIAQLNIEVTNLKNSLSASQALACALAMSNDNMAKQIESRNTDTEMTRVKKIEFQKLLDEIFNQGL